MKIFFNDEQSQVCNAYMIISVVAMNYLEL